MLVLSKLNFSPTNMTLIIARKTENGGALYADLTGTVKDSYLTIKRTKLIKFPESRIFLGGCGAGVAKHLFVSAFKRSVHRYFSLKDLKDFWYQNYKEIDARFLGFYYNDMIFFDSDGECTLIDNEFFAIGSGEEPALAILNYMGNNVDVPLLFKSVNKVNPFISPEFEEIIIPQ